MVTDITLNYEAVRTELSDFRQSIFGDIFVLVVVDGYSGSLSANFSAMPLPIPRELPVTSACFPFSDINTSRLGAHFSVEKAERSGP